MAENILVEKWSDLIETDKAKAVSNKEGIAQLLENEEQYIVNEASQTADMAQYTPILVPAIRRIFPNLLANEIVGVQPMNSPTGYAYALRYAYDGAPGPGGNGGLTQGNSGAFNSTNHRGQYGGTTAGRDGDVNGFFVQAVAITSPALSAGVGETATLAGKLATVTFKSQDETTVVLQFANTVDCAYAVANGKGTTFSTGASASTTCAFISNNEAGFNTILPSFIPVVNTAAGETMGAKNGVHGFDGIPFPNMKMSLERIAIEAMSRKLKAEYSIELAQDLKSVHGLDAEAELINILEYEITAEIDRELVNRINKVATLTTPWLYSGYSITASGGGSLNASDGRWEAERFRTLYTRIIKEANQVALTTRRGTANFIIASANVITALESLTNFMYSAIPGDVKPTFGVAKVGTLDGRFAVYMDTFTTNDYVTIGYKGASQFDTGVIYCPYVPLLLQKVTDPLTFQPKIAFMTRDAIAENLFGAASYYRTFKVDLSGSSLAEMGAPYGSYTGGTPVYANGWNR